MNGNKGMRKVLIYLIAAGFGSVFCGGMENVLGSARNLYQQTNYKQSLALLEQIASPGAEEYCLIGRNYLMLGNYKKATDTIQRAVDMEPANSDYYLWLGRAWGRRAETSSLFSAPASASKARQAFERAV